VRGVESDDRARDARQLRDLRLVLFFTDEVYALPELCVMVRT